MTTKISELREGDWIKVTGDYFDCMCEGDLKQVKLSTGGDFFIDCTEGGHLLDGQCEDDDSTLIGLEKVDIKAL